MSARKGGFPGPRRGEARGFAIEIAAAADGAAVELRLRRTEERLARRLPDVFREPELPFNGWSDFREDGRLTPKAAVHSPFIRHSRRVEDVPAWPGLFAQISDME